MKLRKHTYHSLMLLLFCLIPFAAVDHASAQHIISPSDSLKNLPKAYKHRIGEAALRDSLIADSIKQANQRAIKLNENKANANKLAADSIKHHRPIFTPNSARATWLAAVFPGAGQIYNRKYWKIPIIYGGFIGCAYALSWNNKYYKDYSQAYLDIMSNDPTRTSYLNFLPKGYIVNSSNLSWLKTVFKDKKDYYRKYRDMSIFAFIGVYILSVIDAYVDAELSHVDITPDISMHVEPAALNYANDFNRKAIGLQCSINF